MRFVGIDGTVVEGLYSCVCVCVRDDVPGGFDRRRGGGCVEWVERLTGYSFFTRYASAGRGVFGRI